MENNSSILDGVLKVFFYGFYHGKSCFFDHHFGESRERNLPTVHGFQANERYTSWGEGSDT